MSGLSANLVVSGTVHAAFGLFITLFAGHTLQAKPESHFTVALLTEAVAAAGRELEPPSLPRLRQAQKPVQPTHREPAAAREQKTATPAVPVKSVESQSERDDLQTAAPSASGSGKPEAAGSSPAMQSGSRASGAATGATGAASGNHPGSDSSSFVPLPDPLALIRQAIERKLVYPLIAQRKRIEGTVMISFRINQQGLPEEIRVLRGSGHAMLDSAARETIIKASPYPAVNGVIEIPVTYRLAGRSQ